MTRLAWGSCVALFALLASATTVGCADPEGELNKFADRCKAQVERGDFDGGTTCDPVKGACDTECTTAAPGAIDGQFYFALSASIATIQPLIFLADVTTADNGGQLEVTWELQPLAVADRKTPVGSKITVGPMPVVNGGLGFVAPELAVDDGDANPISGSPIRATNLTILSCPGAAAGEPGGVCEVTDFYCGTIPKGTVVEPAMLDIGGSTWTMTRVTSQADYPEPPPINCAGDLAQAL